MELRDPVSSLSHLLAAVWAAFAILILLRITLPSYPRYFTVTVYGLSMVYLYMASAAFHAWPLVPEEHPAGFHRLQLLDRTGIFLLIAGTNTPIMTILLRGRWRQWCLCGMWGLSLFGVACVWLLPKPPDSAMVLVCLGMGWFGLLPVKRYSQLLVRPAIGWAIAGGLLYSAGAICELLEWPMSTSTAIRFGHHEVFHILTVGGSLAFFGFIARYVVRFPALPD